MGLIRYSCSHISCPLNRFMYLMCEGFSWCSTEIWSWKCWNTKTTIWWRHTSVPFHTFELVNIWTTEIFTFTFWNISLIKTLSIIREWMLWNTMQKQNIMKRICNISFVLMYMISFYYYFIFYFALYFFFKFNVVKVLMMLQITVHSMQIQTR